LYFNVQFESKFDPRIPALCVCPTLASLSRIPRISRLRRPNRLQWLRTQQCWSYYRIRNISHLPVGHFVKNLRRWAWQTPGLRL